MDTQKLVQRVESEFREMPGLRLTPAQAARLWHLDAALCLRWTHTGALVRVEH
jgi:hypothetical protein